MLVAITALLAAFITSARVQWPGGADVVARVNGQSIAQAEYHRAIQAMQAGLQRPLTNEDRRQALQYLIDETLLVQEAVRLDLAQTDRLVRKNLVEALLRSVRSLHVETEITPPARMAFYEAHKSWFASPRQLGLMVALWQGEPLQADVAAVRFKEVIAAGGTFAQAAESEGFALRSLPEALPLGKVNDVLGGRAGALALNMQMGDIAGPVQGADGLMFLWAWEVTGGNADYAGLEDVIDTEILRRRDEAATVAYLERLRKKARVYQRLPATDG